MLPFVFVDESKLGPLHPYGILCALGFLAWDWAVMRQAKRRGLDRGDFRALTVWLLVVGTLFAWVVDGVFYHPPGHSVASSLASLQGFSSTGGVLGATVGAYVWRHVFVGRVGGKLRVMRRAEPEPMMPVADVIVSTWPLGWAIGRLGCAIIHDHPGVTVPKGTLASLFAVAWPRDATDGLHHVLGPIHVVTGGSDARFDLGLLEAILLGAIALGFSRTWRRGLRPGKYVAVGSIVYGAARFGLDFLRMHEGPNSDLRHAGLTFAQFFSLAIIALGVGVTLWMRGQPRESAGLATDAAEPAS
jgi:phosphatidylglycerol---prolipoprotein diacylglyceryl transferase